MTNVKRLGAEDRRLKGFLEELKAESVSFESERVSPEEVVRLLESWETVTISNDGMYHAKSVKLYGRRILSVNDKAEYVLGGWEQLNPNTSMHGLASDTFNIGADYAQFAFSFDITWGTDFPFSGIFWDKTYTTNWNELDITMNGTCRSANLYIAIGGKRYKSVQDCYSHKEWRP